VTEQSFNLILIAGAMRSGTSLLQHVLCSSPAANPFVHGCRYLTSQIAIYAQYAGTDRLYVKDYLGGPEGHFEFSKGIVDRLLAETHDRLGRPQHLVLKNPELSGYLPQAAALLPQARFVISVRDPKDTIASMIGVGDKHRKTGVTSFLASAGRDIDRLSASYRKFYTPVLQALEQVRGGLGERICISTYESLIADTDRAVDRLAQFCRIPLSPEGIGGAAGRRSKVYRKDDELLNHPRWGAYVTGLSGGPISDASVGRYRAVLSATEAQRIDRLCADLRRAFGYEETV
jgi:hypothetical protein